MKITVSHLTYVFYLILIIAIYMSSEFFVPKVYAQETFTTTTTLNQKRELGIRTETLKRFFNKYNSVLKDNAKTFVEEADYYGFDYKLLPAISCMESTCAKFLIKETHNPFGWGGGTIYFDSYDEAIEKVAKGLDTGYIKKGRNTPKNIAPIYTPPNYVNWTKGVNFFMDQINDIEKKVEIELDKQCIE